MTKLAPKTISQHKLKRYLELELLAKEFEELKKEIRGLAKSGLPCQPGRYSCSVRTTSSTSIPWKEEFVNAVGQSAADRIAKGYQGNSKRTSLVVTDRENPLG